MNLRFASFLGFTAFAVALLSLSGSAAAQYGYCGDGYCDLYAGEQYYCSYDCNYYGGGGYDYCQIYAPGVVSTGEVVPVDIYYGGYYPHSATVDCGNGRQRIAYFTYGGYAYTECFYDYPGTYFIDSYAGGSAPACRTTVIVQGQPPDYGYCGDGDCGVGEDSYICPADCDRYAYCGDGSCNQNENVYNCPEDCGYTPRCGDGRCTDGETQQSCPQDCGYPPRCGDGVCNGNENQQSCPQDCGYPPGEKSCALTASPSRLTAGQTSAITVHYYNMQSQPNSIQVRCGNSRTANAVGCSGTTGSCTATCLYPQQGTFNAGADAGGVSCSETQVEVTPPYQPPVCSSNSQCGTDGFVGSAYCFDNDVYKDYKRNTCNNPGQQNSYCSQETEQRKVQECQYGCENAQCKRQPTHPTCSITAYPNPVDEGAGSVLTVRYYEMPRAPNSIQVNCGDGESRYANSCAGTTGSCSVFCSYENPGRFTPSATVLDTMCGADTVTVNEVALPVACSNDAQCGTDGFVGATYCRNDDVYQNYRTFTCNNPGQENSYCSRDDGPRLLQQCEFGCENGACKSQSAEPSCAMTAVPARVLEGGSSSIVINYYNLPRPPNSIPVDCGNNLNGNAVNCFGTTGSCAANCFYPSAGTYYTAALASGTACTPATVSVGEVQENNFCRDGTRFGECSANKPYFCDEGFLIKDAQLCGCPAGYRPSGSDCVQSIGSCSVSLNPQEIQPNEPTAVIVSYRDMAEVPEATVYCGDGRTAAASCSESTPGRGSCTAECSYGEQSSYPKNFQVSALANGVRCSSATAKVVAPDETTGKLLVKVTDCDSGSALQGARVDVSGEEAAFTDQFGQVKLTLEPGTYTALVSKEDYESESVTKTVERGKTATAAVCLEQAVTCDIDAKLASAPRASESRTPLVYQINLTNNLDESNTVTLEYSSFVFLSGPSTVTLQPRASSIVSVEAFPQPGFNGDSLGMVTIKGGGGCAKSVSLPIRVVGGLLLEANGLEKNALPGERACFDLVLRNQGPNQGVVVFLSTPLDSGDGDFEASFDTPRYNIAPHEIKDLKFCVDVPSGAEEGGHSFSVTAQSPISDSSIVVKVNVGDTEGFSSDTLGCYYVRDSSQRPIDITNDVESGDYAVELRNNVVNAEITPQVLYNFKKDTTRTVYFSVNPDNLDAFERHVELLLKKDGRVVMQRDLCLRKYGYYYGGGGGTMGYSVFTQLLQSTLQLARGYSGSVTLKVKNDGGITDSYLISVSGLSGSASPSTFTLRPGEEKDVRITVTANANPGTYTVPIKVYSTRRGGYYFDGYDYDYYYDYCAGDQQCMDYYRDRYYGGYYDETYRYAISGGEIRCGNGRTVSVNCRGSSGTCSGSCEYRDDREYTVNADVGDTSCEYAKIKAVDEDETACQVGVESFIRPASTARVTVYYRNLESEPADHKIQVDCGDGNTVYATGCVGRTGSCTAGCYYSERRVYIVSASTPEESCGIARINVDNKGNYCSINAEALVAVDREAEVELTYRGVEYGPYYDPYRGQQNNLLLKTENLVVTITGAGVGGVTPTPAAGEAISIRTVVAQDLAANGTATVSVAIKNNANAVSEPISVFIEDLPQGVTAEQAAPVTLRPFEEKTVRVRLQGSNAAVPGVYRPRASISAAGTTQSKPFELEIVPASLIIEAEIRPAANLECNGNSVTATFFVRNSEQRDIGVSALLRGLPEGWSFRADPLYQIIKPGEEKNFSMQVNTTGFESKSYPVVFEVRQRDERRASEPYDLPMYQCGGGLLSGLIVLTSSFTVWQLLVVLGVLAIGLFMYYSAKPKDGEGQASAPVGETAEGKKDLRQLTLEGMKEEVSRKRETLEFERSSASEEAYLGEPPTEDNK